jgi:hypothetical protein
MGNYHAQFLGGLGLATAPGYPVFLKILFCAIFSIYQKFVDWKVGHNIWYPPSFFPNKEY